MGKGYVHLSLEERCLIQAGLSMRQSPAAIAAVKFEGARRNGHGSV